MSLIRQIWQLPKAGDLGRLQLASDDLSEPGAGCVTVRVAAVGLNFADLFACLGLYFLGMPPRFITRLYG